MTMENTQIINGRRIASDRIATLGEKEIFVFGSNIHGAHGGGAAWYLTGRTYALPTMEGEASMAHAVERFISCAKEHPELTFLVTAVGCGIAGYTPQQVAPLFKEALSLENVYLPQVFMQILDI